MSNIQKFTYSQYFVFFKWPPPIARTLKNEANKKSPKLSGLFLHLMIMGLAYHKVFTRARWPAPAPALAR